MLVSEDPKVQDKREGLINAKGELKVGRRPSPDEQAQIDPEAPSELNARSRASVLGVALGVIVIAVVIILVLLVGGSRSL